MKVQHVRNGNVYTVVDEDRMRGEYAIVGPGIGDDAECPLWVPASNYRTVS